MTDGNEGHDGTLPAKAPRLYHKKSRSGCQQCKARKVKCNEVHPTCGNCERHHITCVYDQDTIEWSAKRQLSPNTGPQRRAEHPAIAANPGRIIGLEIQESKARRLLELRLVHHFTTKTALWMPCANDAYIREISTTEIPALAFKHESLLHRICCFAALHIAKTDPHDFEAITAYQYYVGLALTEHQEGVATLNASNADAVCLSSSFVRMEEFVALQDRLIDPYTAPTQWLRIASTAISIYKESWEWIFYDDKSVTMKAMEGEPVIRDTETLFRESNRTNFLHLLQRDGHPRYKDEPWNDDVQGAYESTVSYIGTISQAINDGEVPLQIARRIMGFPILAPTLFTELLEQRQPRALVILAHFFALTVGTTEVWWIGYTGRREVGGIQSILPEEWKPLMKWPIQLADKAWMYRSDRLQNLIRDAVHALYLPI